MIELTVIKPHIYNNISREKCRNGHLWDLEHDNSCEYCVAVRGYKYETSYNR